MNFFEKTALPRLRDDQGFTLIEMLIVVAIIAILASVVLVGLGPTRRLGRDSRRISDLASVQNGLELYYNKCGYYPGGPEAASPCGAYGAIATWAQLTASLTGSTIGITNIPNDPLAGTNYFYGASATGNGYVLGATLEDANNSSLANDIDTNPIYGVNCTDPTYCVQL